MFKFGESAVARSFGCGDLLHLTLAACEQQLVLVKGAIDAKELEDPPGDTHCALLPQPPFPVTKCLSSVCSQSPCGHRRGDYAREGPHVFRTLLVYLEVVWAKSQVAHAASLLSSVYTYTSTQMEGIKVARSRRN